MRNAPFSSNFPPCSKTEGALSEHSLRKVDEFIDKCEERDLNVGMVHPHQFEQQQQLDLETARNYESILVEALEVAEELVARYYSRHNEIRRQAVPRRQDWIKYSKQIDNY